MEKKILNKEFLRMQQLAGIIIEGVLNENIDDDVKEYLKYHFEVYLEGGDTFEEKPGKTHTFTMESDEFGNPEYYDDADIFKKAIEQLKNSSFVLDYSEAGYGNITFKSNGQDIMISFVVPK